MIQSKENTFSDEDFASVARAIEVFVFRNAAIAGMTANKTEVRFAALRFGILENSLRKIINWLMAVL